MKYTRLLAAALIMLCISSACTAQDTNQPEKDGTAEYGTTATETGTQYQSSWIRGISKAAASQNTAVADWLALCSAPERDDIGHYVLHGKTDNSDGTTTHHLLLYRSATEKDCKTFTVTFAEGTDTLTVTPVYTSADTSAYGYDLIYLTLCASSTLALSVEPLVDGDYPGAIQSTTAASITPDTFGTQADE